MVENEAILRQKIMEQTNSRSKRSADEDITSKSFQNAKLMATNCAELLTKYAKYGMPKKAQVGDRGMILLTSAFSHCSLFMHALSTEIKKASENNGKTDVHLLQDQGI